MTDHYEMSSGPSVFMDGSSDWIFRTVGRPGIVGTFVGRHEDAVRALRLLNEVAQHEQRREEAERAQAEQLAAALHIALYDAHPTYGSTAGWRGGVGGQTLTPGCSFIDPPPRMEWLQNDGLSKPLRHYVDTHPLFRLHEAKRGMLGNLAQRKGDE